MRPKLEYMHRVMRTAHRQQRPDRIKIHTIDPRLPRAPPELIQLLRAGDAPHPDHRALFGGGGEEGAGAVEREGGEGRFVGADELGYGEGFGGEEEDVAGGLLGGRGGVGGGGGCGGGAERCRCWEGRGIGEVGVLD